MNEIVEISSVILSAVHQSQTTLHSKENRPHAVDKRRSETRGQGLTRVDNLIKISRWQPMKSGGCLARIDNGSLVPKYLKNTTRIMVPCDNTAVISLLRIHHERYRWKGARERDHSSSKKERGRGERCLQDRVQQENQRQQWLSSHS